MIQIKSKEEKEYLLVDSLLIIIGTKPISNIQNLQYQLLICGILVQKPLLVETIEYMFEKKLISHILK